VPHLATCIFLFFYNEPVLGVEIDPGMVLTPLPSSIGRGSNPQPSDCEPGIFNFNDRLVIGFGFDQYVSSHFSGPLGPIFNKACPSSPSLNSCVN